MFYVDLVVTMLYKYWKANWMARLFKGDLNVGLCGSTTSKTGPIWIRTLPLNELSKIELIGELAHRGHVDLLYTTTVTEDDS